LNEKELWMKILGNKIHSFTDDTKEYFIFYDDSGPTCTCMDYKIRKGSYQIVFQDPNKPQGLQGNHIQGCKHIAQYLANIGMKNVTKTGASCYHEKVEPRTKYP